MSGLINRASEICGLVSAWLLVGTGAALTYEVVARYVFNAPTTWATESSELMLMWAVFLGLSYTIRHNRNIVIDILYEHLPAGWQRLLDAFSALVIIAFSLVVIWYGSSIAWDSFVVGRTTATILNYPNWWAEASVPVGFTFAALQCLLEGLKALTGTGWTPGTGSEAH